MLIEIWSDIMCPFCYIGKKRFESALQQFEHNNQVQVVWKSFQLNPALLEQSDVDVYDYLAKLKGQTREWSQNQHDRIAKMAANEGLVYNFDKVKICNSMNAHRLMQLAKKRNKDEAMAERLFKAHFTEGATLSDPQTLLNLAVEAGLSADEVKVVLQHKRFEEEVLNDHKEAVELGATGVPFFVIDRKFAISGAQEVDVFLTGLNKALQASNA